MPRVWSEIISSFRYFNFSRALNRSSFVYQYVLPITRWNMIKTKTIKKTTEKRSSGKLQFENKNGLGGLFGKSRRRGPGSGRRDVAPPGTYNSQPSSPCSTPVQTRSSRSSIRAFFTVVSLVVFTNRIVQLQRASSLGAIVLTPYEYP